MTRGIRVFVLSILLVFIFSLSASASEVFVRKDYLATPKGSRSYSGQYTTGPLGVRTHWRFNATLQNSGYAYQIGLERLTEGRFVWRGSSDHRSSLTIKLTKTTIASATETSTISSKLGLSIPVNALKVSGEIGGSRTTSQTYTVTSTITHAHTLNRTSPAGRYSLKHTVYADRYRVNTDKRILRVWRSYSTNDQIYRYHTTTGDIDIWRHNL
ncbi:hypothetical protein [Anaerobranca gottschalkii]|uniref:Uncharacterized protein n=1 Tax=Anaerobranca gottschalkii DSM 13577 TaxID=1120990 RepID=A0A1H9YDI4_9FIRM|nr:hypothetical protein [Anaerobranca gottschalkii]SES66941.1 hypothetical protein SAMN03080614_1002129 [Anaerobranca gottschalkii DSM 13577]